MIYRQAAEELERFRSTDKDSQRFKGRMLGIFILPHKSVRLACIVHDGNEMDYLTQGIHGPRWEHVSVSVLDCSGKPLARVPNWEEMCFVKRTFWRPEETVLQFHPAEAKYVNAHDYVLHLWRQVGIDHPLPQSELV